ncbi:MAG TPA: hypothetical protein VNG31_07870 [Candidatus Baltobacteraceae bacterium]|nr:hypothetical protein [Candidatus Baltobacteraceae bacterium]
MRRALLIAALLMLCVGRIGYAPAWASCDLRTGTHVVLYSAVDDPDVLAWDSRFRLRDYHAASFDEAEELLPHAVLEAPGTRAAILSCVPGFVTSRVLLTTEDAVGVIILTGPDRGHARWVLGSDVRSVEPAATSRAKTRSVPSSSATRSIVTP